MLWQDHSFIIFDQIWFEWVHIFQIESKTKLIHKKSQVGNIYIIYEILYYTLFFNPHDLASENISTFSDRARSTTNAISIWRTSHQNTEVWFNWFVDLTGWNSSYVISVSLVGLIGAWCLTPMPKPNIAGKGCKEQFYNFSRSGTQTCWYWGSGHATGRG